MGPVSSSHNQHHHQPELSNINIDTSIFRILDFWTALQSRPKATVPVHKPLQFAISAVLQFRGIMTGGGPAEYFTLYLSECYECWMFLCPQSAVAGADKLDLYFTISISPRNLPANSHHHQLQWCNWTRSRGLGRLEYWYSVTSDSDEIFRSLVFSI